MDRLGVAWSAFEAAEAELAQRIAARFESHRHAVLATLSTGGGPRLSGLEAPIRDGHLWLAMMPDARKADDLRRDARFSMHSAPDAEEMAAGDAKVDGRAELAGAGDVELFVSGHRLAIDDPSSILLFTARVERATLSRVADGEMVIESWTPAGGATTFRRT